MDITDIPQQISTALKYSLRSRTSFLLSFFGAILVCGTAYSVVYDFFYTRLYNVKDSHYGRAFWLGLLTAAFLFPVVYGIVSLLRARHTERPFPPERYGIAIAPFDVVSLDPDTLGTSSKLRALDQIMSQLFTAQQRFIEDEQWSGSFEFRFLPSYVRILKKKDAEGRRLRMNALLIISGQIVQQTGSGVQLRMHILGLDTDLTMNIPRIEAASLETTLKYFVLTSAAYSEQKRGRVDQAIQLYTFSEAPAAELDRQATPGGTSALASVKQSLQELDRIRNHSATRPEDFSPNGPA